MASIPSAKSLRAAKVFSAIKRMTAEERNRLFFAIENQPHLFAETEHVILPKKLYEFLLRTTKESLVLQEKTQAHAESLDRNMDALLERFGSMVAMPRKTVRNELIQRYQTELQLDFPQIYKVIMEEHPDLLTIGTGKKSRPVQLQSMVKEYKRWLRNKSE